MSADDFLVVQSEQIRCRSCGTRSWVCVDNLLWGHGDLCCSGCAHPQWSPS